MKTYLFQMVILVLLVSSCGKKVENTDSSTIDYLDKTKKIDSLMQTLVVNGHSAGIVYGLQKGSHTHSKAFGMANLETGRKVDTNTVFGMASITKPFTAIAIAQLIEQGKLRFEDPLSEYFPDFPKAGEVTLYQLLSHTSGVNEWWVGGLPKDTPEDWVNSENPHQYLQRMTNPYLFEPGTKYSYSNMGYLLLGELIEQVSGKKYETYLKDHIFEPLRMQNTRLASGEETFGNLARGYHPEDTGDSLASVKLVASPFIAGSLKSFGGLKSNISDMLLWSKAVQHGELIGADSWVQMTSYAKVVDKTPVYEARYVDPKYPPHPPVEFMKKDGYGLGFSKTEIFGKTALWHSGGMPGYNSLWFYFPELEVSFLAFSNTDNGLMPVFEQVMQIITDEGV